MSWHTDRLKAQRKVAVPPKPAQKKAQSKPKVKAKATKKSKKKASE